jgi:hypothetical protein
MKLQTKDYQLRHAAGKYWLLDMRQQGFAYRPPLCLNASGAFLWELLAKGMSRREAARQLAQAFGLAEKEALQDVDSFVQQFAGPPEENAVSD